MEIIKLNNKNIAYMVNRIMEGIKVKPIYRKRDSDYYDYDGEDINDNDININGDDIEREVEDLYLSNPDAMPLDNIKWIDIAQQLPSLSNIPIYYLNNDNVSYIRWHINNAIDYLRNKFYND